mmetsp:Transcript_12560/g.14385  ORF Transcript_12560/g.14385 Transcript_12560/m.14385 type:complete len:94 (+) Transcript_12560:202-483(+)
MLFGNETEVQTLAKILGYESTDTESCVKFVTSYSPSEEGTSVDKQIFKQSRLVLISMDKNGAILDEYSFVEDKHNIIQVPSILIEESLVVDTC